MANYFLDPVNGASANNGLTMDTAWKYMWNVLAKNTFNAGDRIWVRRTLNETVNANIAVGDSGDSGAPIEFIGWPRTTFTVTSATWTKGSTTVDVVLPATLATTSHCGRYITAPNGQTFLITKITDANTFIIDRSYPGESVSGVGGAATIAADEDYTVAQAINDGAWTIKKAHWNADPDTLATMNWNNNQVYIEFNSKHHVSVKNVYLWNIGQAWYYFYLNNYPYLVKFQGCLFLISRDNAYFMAGSSTGAKGQFLVKRVIAWSDAGATGGFITSGGLWEFSDVAIYGLGGASLFAIGASSGAGASLISLNNVNIGVEATNAGYGIRCGTQTFFRRCKDVKFGTNSAGNVFTGSFYGNSESVIGIENFQKMQGESRKYLRSGMITKVPADGTGSYPNLRTDGSDDVLEIISNLNGEFTYSATLDRDFYPEVFTHEFIMPAQSKNFRYYVQLNDTADYTSAYAWLECEYVSSSNPDDGSFSTTKVNSTNGILKRTSASDWSQYLEVTGITPVVTSKVRIILKTRFYRFTGGKLYIDPMPVIT